MTFTKAGNPDNFDPDADSGIIEPETEPAKPMEITARQENTCKTTPVSARSILTRAFQRTGGRNNAIKAKCLDCCNFDREEIRHCAVEVCPLWAWRPFQPK